MSKKSNLQNLKRRINYANSHLSTSLGTEIMNEFKPSEPLNTKNIAKISRELKKWQAEKKFKKKKENFFIILYNFNENMTNNAFKFNVLPKNENQLKHYMIHWLRTSLLLRARLMYCRFIDGDESARIYYNWQLFK
ncbi:MULTISPECIES: hypothetical protein [unclassified Bartonella]|uniref:hypothetical protein n=1 Tax=Bartonella TaxID=773 RepID=UPI0035D0D8A3